MVHIREDVEQHRIFELSVRFHQSLDAEHKETVVGDVGMPVEEFALGTHTHGMETEAEFPKQILCKQGF